jgi:cytochrome c-type biogenesis protein CcmH
LLFWIAAAALTALATALVLHPLMRRHDAEDRAAFDVAVYRDQLAEVDRDLERGVLTAEQAAGARAEIGRRLLHADAARGRAGAPVVGTAAKRTAMALAVGLPLAALAVYLPTGRPDLPAQPLASRGDLDRGPPPEVLTALANLEAHLRDNPDDVDALALAGQTYFRMGRHREAAEAFGRAAGLSQGDPEHVSSFAEALTYADQGIVGDQALRAFTAVADANPFDMRARFYIGLARLQAGDTRGALDRWAAIIAESPADAPWLDRIRAQVRLVAGQEAIDPSPWLPQSRPPVGQPRPAVPEGGGEIAALPAEQQQQAIRGMVERLAARLDEDPSDVPGWLRLAQAWRVLGEADKADAALARAREAAPDDLQVIFQTGVQAALAGRAEEARALWTRVLEALPEGSRERGEVQRALDSLTPGG